MALTDLPKLTPSKGTIFFMAAFLATFSYFFTRSATPSETKTDRQICKNG